METIRKQFEKELKNLDITEEEVISARIVTKKFKRKALLVHSDKTRNGDDEAFQYLLSDYKKLIDALENIGEEKEKLDVKSDLQEFFEKHNIAKEFSQSWTILIEKEKVDRWNKEMLKRFPEPKFLQGHGTQYKSSMEEGNVFTTLYDVMVPKMNIQGNQKGIRKFVIDVLPDLYRAVSEGTQIETQRSNFLPLNTRVKLSAETTYSCDLCDKKYIRKPALRKHIQIKHAASVDPAKKTVCSANPAIPLPLVPDARESDNALAVEECPEVYKQWQCSECGEIFNIENQMIEHMNQDHKDESVHCTACGETFIEESSMIIHVSENHGGEMTCSYAEVVEEIGPNPIETNWQCGECGYMQENESNLREHSLNNHGDTDKQLDKIVYLIPKSCKPCDAKDKKIEELEATVRAFEVLQRRHEQLKEKHGEVVDANKEYSKSILNILKENNEMKAKADKDAEALMDTLSMNQVLVEEVKVKDATIKAQEEEMKCITKVVETDKEERDELSKRNQQKVVKCGECEWTSLDWSKLAGHMLKHKGQYFCVECNHGHRSKKEMEEHIQTEHRNRNKNITVSCNICRQEFPTEHSLKQHTQSKHKKSVQLPVGHPNRVNADSQRMLISCTECDKRFVSANQVEEHIKQHEDRTDQNQFERINKHKLCRYFRNGFCRRGEECNFKHSEEQRDRVSKCKRGQECVFFQQNRCHFFHPGYGVQKPRNQNNNKRRECRYKEQCRNIPNCNFLHPQGFQFSQKQTWPPQRNIWKDY